MTNEIANAIVKFEKKIKEGQVVSAFWTTCYRTCVATAVVIRVNNSSVRVRLSESLDGFPEGHELTLPRLWAKKWSFNNRISPFPRVRENEYAPYLVFEGQSENEES